MSEWQASRAKPPGSGLDLGGSLVLSRLTFLVFAVALTAVGCSPGDAAGKTTPRRRSR